MFLAGRRALEAALARTRADHAAEMNARTVRHQCEIDALVVRHQCEMQALRSQLRDQHERMREQHERELQVRFFFLNPPLLYPYVATPFLLHVEKINSCF